MVDYKDAYSMLLEKYYKCFRENVDLRLAVSSLQSRLKTEYKSHLDEASKICELNKTKQIHDRRC